MTLTIHPDLVQGTEEWLAARRGMVTASVVGQLITTRKLSAIDYDCPECSATTDNPCQSLRKPGAIIKTLHPARAEYARSQSSSLVIEPASNDASRGLTAMLAAERINGFNDDPSFTSDDMWRGVESEPIARSIYGEKYAPVTEVGFMVLERDGFKLGYSPDGLVGDDGLLEIKAPRAKGHLSTILAGYPPIEYMPQLQAGLLISGRKWIDYVSYHGGMPLWPHRVYPDARWFDAITKAARNFEANVTEMMRIYSEAVEGLPMTERTVENLGLVI